MTVGTMAASARGARRIEGLYAVTPDVDDTALLARLVEAAIAGGARAVQYRHKTAAPALRREQAAALLAACRAHGVPLVVNDDWRLAVEIGADGVHLGGEDGDPRAVRAAIGPAMLLGVSCYDRFERAVAVDGVADHVAFGSVFVSGTKPAAVRAPLELLGRARARGWNVVAIGGIDADNARTAIEAGADAVAVIGAVFEHPQPAAVAARARTISRLACNAPPGGGPLAASNDVDAENVD